MSEIYTISNSKLTVKISSFGAELQSIVKNENGREYLSDGNPAFWERRSPVLFPVVGSLVNDTYRYNGKEYHIYQHGFARNKEFSLIDIQDTSVCFGLRADDEMKKDYPFDFALFITYTLCDSELLVEWKVENKDDHTMYYSIGGHPAFTLPLDKDRNECFIKLDKVPTRITNIVGKYADEELNVIGYANVEGQYIRLRDDLFANDALVFEDNQLNSIALCEGKEPYLEVKFSAPCVGVWAPYKPNCPFVCIEPWYGRCDSMGFNGTLEERKWGNKLDVNASASYKYTITIY